MKAVSSIVVVGVIIILLAMGVYTGVIFDIYGSQDDNVVGCGFTTLSIDNVQFTPSSTYIGGPQWIINAIGGEMCQNYNLYLTPSTLQDAERDVSLELQTMRQACEFDIYHDPATPQIARYTVVDGVSCDPYITLAQRCPASDDGIGVFSGRYLYSPTCFCVYEDVVTTGVDPELFPDRYRTQGTFAVTAVGKETIYADFDTAGQTGQAQGYIPENDPQQRAYFNYLGHLITDSCNNALPGGLQYMAYYTTEFGQNEWVGNLKSEYDLYVNRQQDFITDLKTACTSGEIIPLFGDACLQTTDPATGAPGIWNIVGEISTRSDAVLTPEIIVSVPGDSGALPYTTGARITQPLDHQAAAPQFVFYLNGEWVEMVTVTQPEPDINQVGPCRAPLFGTNGGTVSVDVRNDGDSYAADISLSCPAGSGISSATQLGVQVDAGQTRTVNLVVGANVQTPQSYACTVTVNDGTPTQQTCNINVEPTVTGCQGGGIEGEHRCNHILNRIEVCEGTNWVEVETCPYGEVCAEVEPNVYSCEVVNPGECIEQGYPINIFIGQECCEGLVPTGGFLGIGSTCMPGEGEPTDMFFWIMIIVVMLIFAFIIALIVRR